EVHVPLMSDSEIMQIIEIGEQLLNFQMKPAVTKGIVTYSNGLASVCHQLCLNICSAANLEATSQETITIAPDELKSALNMYAADAEDTLKAAFDKAFRQKRTRKYDNCRLILEALAECEQEGAVHSTLLELIRKRQLDYPASNLTQY